MLVQEHAQEQKTESDRRGSMTRESIFSLRARLILLVLIAVIPALGLALYGGLEQRRQAIFDAKDRVLEMARHAASIQWRIVENAHQILFTLSQLPPVRGLDAASCSLIFADLLKRSSGYASFQAIDPDGGIFASAPGFVRPVSVIDFPWFQHILATRDFVVSGHQIGQLTSKDTIVCAYPVLDDAGRLVCVLAIGLDLDWLNQFISEVKLLKGTVLNVVDQSGTILLRSPEPRDFVGKSMADSPIVRTMLTVREGAEESPDLDGRSRLFGFTSLRRPSGSIYVCVGTSTETAYAEADRRTVRNLVWLGALSLLALAAAWFGGDSFILRRVNRLLIATERLSNGDLAARVGPPYWRGELGRLARGFDEMAESLLIREREHAQAEEEIRTLSRRLIETTEQERKRIARDLHDECGQTLTALNFGIETLQNTLPHELEGLKDRCGRLGSLTQQLGDTIRRITQELRPDMLDDLGLVRTIEWQIEDFSQRRSDIQVDFQIFGMKKRLGPDAEIVLYRVFQECMNNVEKHSGAAHVDVRLTYSHPRIILSIRDDGTGFDRTGDRIWGGARRGGIGLPGMTERVASAGGAMTIRSRKGRGTLVRVELPVSVGEPNEQDADPGG
jgi:signal transduction histidine kinase